MMGPEPFQRDVGQGSIPPEKDSLLSSWQNGMRTVCDRESDAQRWRFRRAALCQKYKGEKAKPFKQTGAMVQKAHDEDCSPRFAY